MKRFSIGLSILTLAALTACGGGSSASSAAGDAMQGASNGAHNAMAGAQDAMAGGLAPIPAGLHCGAVKPVWVNTNSKAYHEPGDPYYGRTKHGQYMCPSTAAAQGYHASGKH